MSLFDIIKYPISDPPTVGELRALPINILRKWESEVRRQVSDIRLPVCFIESILLNYRYSLTERVLIGKKGRELFIKIIEEYDDLSSN